MAKNKYYKIKNAYDKYSTGGNRPRFTTKGKVWSHLSHLNTHCAELHNVLVYQDCEIVELTFTEVPIANAFRWANEIKDEIVAKKIEKDAKREIERQIRQEAEEKIKLKELLIKYPEIKEGK